MLDSFLVPVAQALGLILFSALSILLVWVVCGVVFCALTCGGSCRCCDLIEAVRRWRSKGGQTIA